MRFCLPLEAVIAINEEIIGEGHAVLDATKLESALARPLHSFGGELFYPTILERGGVVLHGVCKAHGFADGNKRTAWICTTTFLRSHGVGLADISPSEVADFVEAVAVGEYTIAGIAGWFLDRVD